jgi:photosystem II stability/assembly factor-like uncharacterized protein
MRCSLLAVALSATLLGSAQWNVLSFPAGHINTAVHFSDVNTGYVASNGEIRRTTTGGTSWTQVGFSGADALYHSATNFRAIHVFDVNTAVAVGVNFGDNAEIVIRTVNGGTDWSIVHLGPSGSAFGDMCFPTATRGYAVGKQGRIFRSNDGGATWTQQTNLSTADLNSVRFFDADHGVAVGNNITLRTSNGGSSWTATPIAGVMVGVDAIDAQTFVACAEEDLIVRSIDGGATWNDISLPVGDGLTCVSTYDANTYFVGSGEAIYVTHDQGAHWERFPMVFNSGFVSDVFVPGSFGGVGYAVSQQGGRVFKTTDLGGIAHPIPVIMADTLGACPGGALDFAAPTLTGYSWQWSVDDVPAGTNSTLSHVFPTPNGHTVTLALSNGTFTEELDASVFITPLPTSPAFTVTSSVPAPCDGGFTAFQIPNAQTGGTFRLVIDGIGVGSSLPGNNGPLSTSLQPLDAAHTYGIRETNTNVCGSDSLTVLAPFTLIPLGDVTLPVATVPSLLCAPQPTAVQVDNSQVGVTYQLQLDGFDYRDPLEGNGGTLSLPTYQITGDLTWTVLATNTQGCKSTLNSAATVHYDPMEAAFTVDDPFPVVGQTITVLNAAAAISYTWQLGDNATPATSAIAGPSATYAISGPDTLTVIMQNGSGCLDTLAMEIQVHVPAPAGLGHVCWAELIGKQGGDRWDQGAYRVLDTHISADGSTYATGFFFEEYSWYNVYNMFLLKFAPDGHLLWEHAEQAANWGLANYYSSFGTSLTSDDEGNIYLGGSFCANNFNLGPFAFPNGTMVPGLFINGYIAKLDPSGAYQWVMHSPQETLWTLPTGCSSLAYVDDGHIYGVWRDAGWGVVGGDGITAFQTEAGASQLIHFDSSGHIHGIHGFGPDAGVYEGIFNPDLALGASGKVVLAGPTVKAGAGGRVYIAGNFPRGGPDGQTGLTVQVGAHSISAPNDNVDQNGYLAVYDSTDGWVSGFRTWSTVNTFAAPQDERMFPVFAPDAYGNVLVVFNWSPNEYPATYANEDQLGDGTEVTSDSGAVFMKYGPDGTLLWHTRHSGFQASDVEWDGVHFNVIGQYERALSLESEPPSLVGVDAVGGKDVALIQVSGDGVVTAVKQFASAGVDRSFDLEIHPCGGVQFMGYASADLVMDGIQLHGNDRELYLLRYDTDGACAGTICDPIVLHVAPPDPEPTVSVFPNPSNASFTFMGKGIKQVVIHDAEGRVVATLTGGHANTLVWDAQGMAPGGYAARVMGMDGTSSTLRLVRMP